MDLWFFKKTENERECVVLSSQDPYYMWHQFHSEGALLGVTEERMCTSHNNHFIQ